MVKKVLKGIFLACMIVPTILVILRLQEYRGEDEVIEQVGVLVEQYTASPEEAPVEKSESVPESELVLAEDVPACENDRDYLRIEDLRRENPDVDGVVRIDGTRIDYPVMFTEEMAYYFHRDFYGNDSVYGSIFMDTISKEGCSNKILYGHHMRNGAMFGELDRYEKEEYAAEHAVIKYISEGKIELYEVAAVFSVDASNEDLLDNLPLYYDSQAEKLEELVAECGGKQYLAFEAGAEYISLVTCEYTHEDGRYLVIGKKFSEVQN